MLPEPKCLASLWDAASGAPTSAFVFPIAIQPDGSVGRWGSWCGFLISREIVETVGLPMEELFWWAEDTEYCEWRIPNAGFPRRIIDEAVVHHDAIRQGGDIPAWKYYYESRNMTLLPPSHQAQGGPLSEEDHQLGFEGLSTPAKGSDRMYRSDLPRPLRRGIRASGDLPSGDLLARAGSVAIRFSP